MVLAVSAAVLSVALGVPWIVSAWQRHRDYQQLVAYTNRYMPLARALATLPAPTGLTPVPTNANPRAAVVVGFQWTGHGVTPKQAAKAFQQDLRSAGATDPVGRCTTGSVAVVCRVDATLAGQQFAVFTTAGASLPTHATVTLDFYFEPSGRWLQAKPF